MSWLEKILPSIGKNAKKNIPEGLWSKCPECSSVLYKEEIERLSATSGEDPVDVAKALADNHSSEGQA